MYYHDSCYFMGAVDFVCPRGWCYISNSTFYEVKETAAVWHAAPTNEKQKFVLQNCDFQGADSFYLARHHYEAQFYFMACTFSQLMQNKSIEHVVNKEHPEKNRPYVYGNRYYFYNCSRTGGNYNWFANNTGIWPKGVTPDTISPIWTFDGVWNPTDDLPLEVIKKDVQENFVYLWFNELVMPVGNVILETQSGERITYFLGSGRNRLEFKAKSNISEEELNKPMKIVSGRIQNIQATVAPRFLNSRF